MAKTKVKKVKKTTLSQAKAEAARLGLEVSEEYDKRYLDTWLYTIGEQVSPVKRKQIVHVPKVEKKPLTMSELIALAKEKTDA